MQVAATAVKTENILALLQLSVLHPPKMFSFHSLTLKDFIQLI